MSETDWRTDETKSRQRIAELEAENAKLRRILRQVGLHKEAEGD